MKREVVYFSGQFWLKITPPWVKGPRPVTTYIPLDL